MPLKMPLKMRRLPLPTISVRPLESCPLAARIALESTAVLGAFVALTALLSSVLVRHGRTNKRGGVPRRPVGLASSDGFDHALVAFESFQLSAT